MSTIPPYHLRLNKAVDRFLLIDILRCFTKLELEHYSYAGLGGPFLEDFKLLDTFFPTLNKFSFETDGQVYMRQKFNRPSRLIDLIEGDMIQEIGKYIRDGFSLIVWYDSTSSLEKTFEGFVSLLDAVPDNSIVRVTTRLGRLTSCNKALIASLTQTLKASVQSSDIDSEQKRTLQNDIERIVRAQIEQSNPLWGELSRISRYLPANYLKTKTDACGLAKLVLAAFHQAAIELFPMNSGHSFRLLNASRYSDGTNMLSITGVVLSEAEEEAFMKRFAGTRFELADWTKEPMQINMPILTPKERLHLNQWLPDDTLSGKQLREQLGFSIEPNEKTCEDEMAMYNQFYRYYPVFAKVTL